MNGLLLISIASLLLLLVYSNAGYQALMWFLAKRTPRPWKTDASCEPTISIILAVYNEQAVLSQCLHSLERLDYPRAKLEILVGSDGSIDDTDEIIRDFSALNPTIRGCSFKSRRGKIPVVNDLVALASGEILVFTDADVTLDTNALSNHAKHYSDSQIGGVAGNLSLISGSTLNGPMPSEKSYMSTENKLRLHEAKLSSTIGIFGGNYSIRREYWKPVPDAPICDELYIAGSVIERGKRMVFEPTAIASEDFSRTWHDEIRRKARFAARGLLTIRLMPALAHPRSGWPSFMLFSHKVLRWMSPFLFATIMVLSLIGLSQYSYDRLWFDLVWIEFGLIGIGLLGALTSLTGRRIPILDQMWWFLSMNAAFGWGVIKFVLGKEQQFWTQPTRAVTQHEFAPIQEATPR